MNYMGIDHTGFNVHSRVRAESKEEAERIGKYMIRLILSLNRLSPSHIPDKGQVMVRYYGLYANAHRGKMRNRSRHFVSPYY